MKIKQFKRFNVYIIDNKSYRLTKKGLFQKKNKKLQDLTFEEFNVVQIRDLDRELQSNYNLSITCTPKNESSVSTSI